MHNTDIAAVFFEMADLLAVRGGDVHRSRAFGRIARVVEKLPEPVAVMLRKGTLEDVPGIGDGALHRIKQILRTGTCDDHRRLMAALPPGLAEMLKIRGLGPSRLRVIWSHLRIQTIDQLEMAARANRLAGLPRIGEGTQEAILHGIQSYRNRAGRVSLPIALRRSQELIDGIIEVEGVTKWELGGSLRRRKETSKDIDLLVTTAGDRQAVVDKFKSLDCVVETMIGHQSRASVMLRSGMQADIRVLAPEEFGAGLHYFTGSKDHNIAMRKRADRLGMHLSDHGLFTDEKEVLINPCPTEEEVFAGLGLPWIPPEIREDMGEIQAAERGMLPRLVTDDDVRGDLHVHTTYSDGSGTLEEMLQACADRGHEYVAITDHSYRVRDTLGEQREHINRLRSRFEKQGLRVLHGVEVDIFADGNLELDLEVLADLDFVVGSVHQQFDLPYEIMTARFVRAMESGVVDVIGHPTGRRFSRRDAGQIDMERVMDAARRCSVAMEINGQPDRLDLDAISARHAVETGVPLSVNSDGHSTAELENQRFAVFNARRGWAEPRNILNAWSLPAILQWRHDRIRKRGVPVSWTPPPREADTRRVDRGAAIAAGEPAEPAERPGGDDPVALEARFRGGDVDAALLGRLMAYLQSGDDPPVQAALQAIAPDNPVQGAFNVVFVAQQQLAASSGENAQPQAELTLQSLHVPPRVMESLQEYGIGSLEELLDLTIADVRKIPGIGPKSVDQIVTALGAVDRELKPKAK